MTWILIVLTILAAFLAVVMCGTEETDEQTTILIAYIITICGIVALNILNWAVMLWK